MAKIAMVTDTHAGVRNDNPAFQLYQKRCWEWFFEYIDKHNIRDIIHLGDVYDRRKYVNFMSAKRLREDFFDPLNKRGIVAHMIVGNHDMYYKDTHEVNALDEVISGRYDEVFVHSVPKVIRIGGMDIQLIPWITESNKEAAIEAITKPKASILMGHLEVQGFTMHKGQISDHGMDRNVFDKFDKVYSGHYHHRSTIGNVSYIGAFGEYTWADYNDPRGFSVFDTETSVLEFVKNPHRMFKIARYDDVSNPEIIDTIQKTDFSSYRDTYVKLVVVNKSNPYAFDLLFDSIYKSNPLDIQIVEDPTVLLENEEADEIDEAEDTATILRKYVDGLTLPVNNDRMKNFMLDIYNEALQVETV
jgi:DNA repair exonuclease SbcCD nuclease subunit